MKLILTAISLLFLSGCMSKPYVTEYKILIKEPQIKQNSGECRNKSLKIAQAFSSKSLMSSTMEYTQSDNKLFSYTEAQWQESPNNAVTAQMYKEIRESAIFKSVLSSKSITKSDMILEINIEDFMQSYTQDLSELHVGVVITLTLIDTKTNTVIATKTFKSKVKSKTLNANGGVEAFGVALSDIFEKNIEWLGGVCK